MTALADLRREFAEWWRRRGRPVALEETPWLRFEARVRDIGYIRRRARALRWLRKHGRLRGGRITRLRVLVGVQRERDAMDEQNRQYMQRKAQT